VTPKNVLLALTVLSAIWFLFEYLRSRKFLALLLLLPALASAQAPAPLTLPFREVNGLLFVDIKISGKTASMLLDTGSNVTLVQRAGPDGNITIEIGDRVFTLHAIEIDKSSRIAAEMSRQKDMDGILGGNFMRCFSVMRIDYKAHALVLVP
jgi:hypothetical protein